MAFPWPRKILLPLLLIALAGPAVEYPAPAPGPAPQATESRLPPGWKIYRHAGAPFEFAYPQAFLLDAHVNPKLGFIFALMKKPGTPWLVDIDFHRPRGILHGAILKNVAGGICRGEGPSGL